MDVWIIINRIFCILTKNLDESVSENSEKEEKTRIDKRLNKIKENISDVGEKAKQILNSFIDAIALFIITYCALPIIIVLFVIRFINFLFKINIPTPDLNIKRITEKHKNKERIDCDDKELIEV